MPTSHNWPLMLLQALELVHDDEAHNWSQLARALKVSRTTIRQGFEREFKITSFSMLKEHKPSEEFQEQAQGFVDGDTIRFSEEDNTATAASVSRRIKTLDELLAACKADLSVWRVKRWKAKKWDGFAKDEHKDLVFDEGKISGWLRASGVAVEPLWSIWAEFIRIEPIALFPTIQPVECAVSFRKPPKPPKTGIRRALIWADPHFGFTHDFRNGLLIPFHSRQVLDVILQIAQDAGIDRVVMLGDWLDLAEWSDRFIRRPEFMQCTQPAILESFWWLSQFRHALPKAKMSLHEGNHDERMTRAILTHLRAAYGLRAADEMDLPPAMSVPKLMALHKLHIEWVGDYPDDGEWLNAGIRLSHGSTARGGGGDTAKAVVMAADVTEIFGHIHRMEWVSRTKHLRDGRQVLAGFCPGCACWIDGRVPGKMGRQQWQNGCAIIDYEPKGSRYSITPIPIEDGYAIWDGKAFKARDRLAELRKALPDWNW
jgi:hypothetical protein